MTAKEHYDNHLASFYEWMIGDFETKQKEQQDFFERNGIKSLRNSTAIDLGSGHGIQSISLARLGFKVNAVDFNQQLLDRLATMGKDLAIEVFHRDILSEENFREQANLIVCMGDTISHLEATEQIQGLLVQCYNCLRTSGKLILSFRDYGNDVVDTNRFIPVKSDDNKILTCFLEYFGKRVRVTDLLHEKIDGKWIQRASSYYKVRITGPLIEELLGNVGFKIVKSEIMRGMNFLIVEK
jgi:SAM-dependent methyltransferase